MRDSTIDRVSVISINGEKMRSNETAYTALKASMPDNIYLASAWQRRKYLCPQCKFHFFANLFYYDYFLNCYGQYSLFSKYFVRNL